MTIGAGPMVGCPGGAGFGANSDLNFSKRLEEGRGCSHGEHGTQGVGCNEDVGRGHARFRPGSVEGDPGSADQKLGPHVVDEDISVSAEGWGEDEPGGDPRRQTGGPSESGEEEGVLRAVAAFQSRHVQGRGCGETVAFVDDVAVREPGQCHGSLGSITVTSHRLVSESAKQRIVDLKGRRGPEKFGPLALGGDSPETGMGQVSVVGASHCDQISMGTQFRDFLVGVARDHSLGMGVHDVGDGVGAWWRRSGDRDQGQVHDVGIAMSIIWSALRVRAMGTWRRGSCVGRVQSIGSRSWFGVFAGRRHRSGHGFRSGRGGMRPGCRPLFLCRWVVVAAPSDLSMTVVPAAGVSAATNQDDRGQQATCQDLSLGHFFR